MAVVFFERDGLPLLVDSAGSKRLGARNAFTAALERLEQQLGRLAVSYSRLESLHISSVSSFVETVA